MIKLDLERHKVMLTEKQQNYRHYHKVKLIRIKLPSNQSRIIEQAKFTFLPQKALSKNKLTHLKTKGKANLTHLKTKGKTSESN